MKLAGMNLRDLSHLQHVNSVGQRPLKASSWRDEDIAIDRMLEREARDACEELGDNLCARDFVVARV